MSAFKHCIVTYIDLIGSRDRECASELMRQIPPLVANVMANGMDAHERAYVWNDSIVLLAHLANGAADPTPALREADSLKRLVDEKICPSYAIAVQGMVFPDDQILTPQVFKGADFTQARCVVIKASSFALANCFKIEAVMKERGHRKPWYLDERLATRITTEHSAQKDNMKFLPGDETRSVHMFNGYLWG